MKKYILIILIFNFLQSCSSVSEGFKLKKGNTGDEFLVEKKNPLVLPPNFNELPEPGKTEISDKNIEKSFEEKISNKDSKNENQEENTASNSTEELILKNIKKMIQIEKIKIKNFNKAKPQKNLKSLLNKLIEEDNHIIKSLKNTYKDSWDLKKIKNYKKLSNITLIGMGGSIMGSKSIYSFLKNRIKKNFFFLDNFEDNKIRKIKKKK